METTITKKKYKMMVKFNGIVHKIETDDLLEAILKIKPPALKTRMIFHIETEDEVCNRIVMTQTGRTMFANKIAMGIFLNNLIFKPKNVY